MDVIAKLSPEVRERIDRLREQADTLGSGPEARGEMLAQAARHSEKFLDELQSRRVYQAPGDRDEAMDAMSIGDEPSSWPDALSVLDRYVDGVGHNLGSSRFFAYIPSGGLYESAIADYLAAVSNRYSGVGYAAPGATRMEQVLVDWLAGVVGYPEQADGDLTSGASIGALSAVVAARESFGIKARDVERHVVYVSKQTHHTFRKALHVAGVGECPVHEIETDHAHRMSADALSRRIETDKRSGLKPWFVCATAGTTDVGAVDPLDAIADVAERHELWMHVDAAYGGGFALCGEGSRRLAGLGRSDSVIIDPHKSFFLPSGLGMLLVRDGSKLQDAFRARGTYMQDMEHDTERSPCDLSPELTRPFRALRFWLPLKVHGTTPFAAALEEKLLLADYFHQQLADIPGVIAGEPPDLSIVTFRFDGGTDDATEFNRRLVDAIRDDGRVFLTSTTIDGHFTLRLAILGYNTHLEDVDVALQVIREKAAELRSG